MDACQLMLALLLPCLCCKAVALEHRQGIWVNTQTSHVVPGQLPSSSRERLRLLLIRRGLLAGVLQRNRTTRMSIERKGEIYFKELAQTITSAGRQQNLVGAGLQACDSWLFESTSLLLTEFILALGNLGLSGPSAD